MIVRCCGNCMYSKVVTTHLLRSLVTRFLPGLLLCFNWARCPGEMAEVFGDFKGCRSFRARHVQWGKRGEPPKPKNGVCFILLTQGEVAMVDPEDYEELKKYVWCASRRGKGIYACRRVRRELILMHRVIMKAPKGMIVDHIDGNGLNNCKSNLRLCTRAQNTYNSRPRDGRSGFKGVAYDKRSGKYKAAIGYKYDHVEIGEFDDRVDAARARDLVARALQGEHAWLNLPGRSGARQQTGQGAETVVDGQATDRPVSEEVRQAVQGALARAWRKHPRRYVDLSGRAVCHCRAVANLTVLHGPPKP